MSEASLKEKTAKGLFWSGFSNGMQQLLNLLFGIFLARLLTPDDYGMIGMLAIFSAVAGTLQESGFTMALANKRIVTHQDYNAVFWFSLFMGISMYLILFFSAPLIARFYHNPAIVPLARYVFLGFLVSSTATAHNAYLFRNLMLKQKTQALLPALLISGVTGIFMAYHGMSYWGIATQSLIFITIINLSFWYYSPWHPTLHIDFRPLKEMLGFSSKMLLTNLFTQVNNHLLSTLLGRLFTRQEVGYYTQSNKWNTMGYSFISGTINGVAQPVLAKVSDDSKRQLAVLRKMLRFTSLLAFPAMLGLAYISRELILITITEKWAPCVPMLQLLCLWGAFMPIITLYSNLVISKGKSNIYMWNILSISILQLILMLVCYPYGITTMIQSFVCLNILWVLVWQYFVWKEVKLTPWMAIKDIFPFMFLTLVALGCSWLLTKQLSNLYLLLPAKILTTAVIYIFLLWICRVAIFREGWLFIQNKIFISSK